MQARVHGYPGLEGPRPAILVAGNLGSAGKVDHMTHAWPFQHGDLAGQPSHMWLRAQKKVFPQTKRSCGAF